jgi:hypothetical protein
VVLGSKMTRVQIRKERRDKIMKVLGVNGILLTHKEK